MKCPKCKAEMKPMRPLLKKHIGKWYCAGCETIKEGIKMTKEKESPDSIKEKVLDKLKILEAK